MCMRKISVDLPPGYKIRFADFSDIPSIMFFFENHWKKDHILAYDRAFFEYEFCRGNEVNVVLLLDHEKRIKGTLGYIPYGSVNRDIFTVMWKVIESQDLFLGTALLYFLVENGRCRHIFTSGLNKNTVNIYKYLGMEVVKLNQYYMINPYVKQKIAKICTNDKLCIERFDNNNVWRECNEKEFLSSYSESFKEDRIQKSPEYIIHRYYRNPKYKYSVYRLQKEDKFYFIVFRIQGYQGGRALRVIDYLGDMFLTEEVTDIIWRVMCLEKCEYVDMYAYGLDSVMLKEAGFHLITDTSEDIIPNYFAPFMLENVEILAMHESEIHPYIFKGDGDQDRAS